MKAVLKKLFVSLLVVGSFSLASEMYVFQTADVKIDNNKGILLVGTPVKVLKDVDEKNVLVELTGIAFGGMMYTDKAKSLLMATKEGSFVEKSNAADLTPKKVQIVVEKANLSEDPSEIWEEHEEFFYDNCTQCHSAHEPKTHSMLEWDAILQTMNGFAQLDEEEAAYLARFVKAMSKNGFYSEKK